MKNCPYCAEEIQDAAIVCKHCGRDLQPVAAVPATPAAIEKPKAGIAKVLVYALLACVGLVLVAGLLSNQGEPAAAMKTLSVRVQFSPLSLDVLNSASGAAAGGELIVYINGDPPFTYKAVATMPALGEIVRIPLSSFTKKDGTRFNPLATVVTVAWVGGGGYDYVSIKR